MEDQASRVCEARHSQQGTVSVGWTTAHLLRCTAGLDGAKTVGDFVSFAPGRCFIFNYSYQIAVEPQAASNVIVNHRKRQGREKKVNQTGDGPRLHLSSSY